MFQRVGALYPYQRRVATGGVNNRNWLILHCSPSAIFPFTMSPVCRILGEAALSFARPLGMNGNAAKRPATAAQNTWRISSLTLRIAGAPCSICTQMHNYRLRRAPHGWPVRACACVGRDSEACCRSRHCRPSFVQRDGEGDQGFNLACLRASRITNAVRPATVSGVMDR